jgi:hypothetical protein
LVRRLMPFVLAATILTGCSGSPNPKMKPIDEPQNPSQTNAATQKGLSLADGLNSLLTSDAEDLDWATTDTSGQWLAGSVVSPDDLNQRAAALSIWFKHPEVRAIWFQAYRRNGPESTNESLSFVARSTYEKLVPNMPTATSSVSAWAKAMDLTWMHDPAGESEDNPVAWMRRPQVLEEVAKLHLGDRFGTLTVDGSRSLISLVLHAGGRSRSDRLAETALLATHLLTFGRGTVQVSYEDANEAKVIRATSQDLIDWADQGGELATVAGFLTVDGVRPSHSHRPTEPFDLKDSLSTLAKAQMVVPTGSKLSIGYVAEGGGTAGLVNLEATAAASESWLSVWNRYDEVADQLFSSFPTSFYVQMIVQKGDQAAFLRFYRTQWALWHLSARHGYKSDAVVFPSVAGTYFRYRLTMP